MAGPSIGTWVKVRNKSGRTTARVIANKFGGGSYQQGQVITQSEYNSYKERRAEGMKAQSGSASGGGGQSRQKRQERIAEIRDNINAQARAKLDSIRADQKKKGQRDIGRAYERLDRTKAGKKREALAMKEIRQERANQAAIATGKGNKAKRRAGERIAPTAIRDNPNYLARTKSRLPGIRRPGTSRRRQWANT